MFRNEDGKSADVQNMGDQLNQGEASVSFTNWTITGAQFPLLVQFNFTVLNVWSVRASAAGGIIEIDASQCAIWTRTIGRAWLVTYMESLRRRLRITHSRALRSFDSLSGHDVVERKSILRGRGERRATS